MKRDSHYAQVSFVVEMLVLQPARPPPCPPSQPLNPQPSGPLKFTGKCCVAIDKSRYATGNRLCFADKCRISQVDLVESPPIREEIPISPEIELDSVSFLLVMTRPN